MKAGANVSSFFTTNTNQVVEQTIRQAESLVCATTRYNWLDNYSTLNEDVKYILEEAVSSWSAMAMISYDMGGYTSASEATTMLDVLIDRYNRAIKELKEQSVKNFVEGA